MSTYFFKVKVGDQWCPVSVKAGTAASAQARLEDAGYKGMKTFLWKRFYSDGSLAFYDPAGDKL